MTRAIVESNGMDAQATALLDRLGKFPAALESSTSLDDILHKLALETAGLLDADHCSIMMTQGPTLRVYAHHGTLADDAYGEVVRKGQGISGHVCATGQSLLIENIEASEFAKFARYPSSPGKSMVSAPIVIDGKVAGVINLHGPRSQWAFTTNDLRALEIAAQFSGKGVQVAQLRSGLHSRFAIMSIVMKRRSSIEMLVNEAQDPGKMAKILARSFYRELRRAGFGSDQIINAASEIISELGSSMRKKSSQVNLR